MLQLPSVLKRRVHASLQLFLLPAVWIEDMMAGTPAPMLDHEVDFEIGIMWYKVTR